MSLDDLEKDTAPADPVTADTDTDTSLPPDPFAALENPSVHTAADDALARKKKKKILLFTVIGVFVLLAAIIAALILLVPKKDTGDTSSEVSQNTITILDKTTTTVETSVQSAQFKTTSATIDFINKDDALYVKGYEALPMSTTNMDALQQAITLFTATQDIGEQTDTTAFGFDKPQLAATVTYYDKSTYRFELGNETPDKTGYYFREAGKNRIYIVSTDTANAMLKPASAYVSTTVLAQPETSGSDTEQIVLRSMSLGGTARKDTPFSFRMVTSGDDDSYLYYTYIITSPFTKGANSAGSESLKGFTSLEATDIAAIYPTAAQLKSFGLDAPSTVADFTLALQKTVTGSADASGNTASTTTYTDLQKHTIRLGGMSNENYYVMIDEVPIVYIVPESSLPFATLQYDNFADTLLFLEKIDQMSSMSVTTADQKTTFALAHDADNTDTSTNLTVTANGKTYDTMGFRYLVQNFMKISRYSILKTDTAGLPLKLSFSIVRTGETKPALTISFYQMSSSLYAAILNSGEKYQVKASEVENAILQYQNLLNGKTVLQ